MPIASLAGINLHYAPIRFLAACPRCESEAEWTAFMAQDEALMSWTPHHHIECPTCGPCPCEWHDDGREGVAA